MWPTAGLSRTRGEDGGYITYHLAEEHEHDANVACEEEDEKEQDALLEDDEGPGYLHQLLLEIPSLVDHERV